jgi:hypothetical protein
VSARRVFVSHSSELNQYPPGRSYVRAAIDGIIRADDAPADMSYFTARDQQAAEYCVQQVRSCDVYLGLIGFRYGSQVRDRPELSYTELEFEAATAAGRERLVFLLDEDSNELGLPSKYSFDPNPEYQARQQAFRRSLKQQSGVVRRIGNAQELEMLVYQALVQLRPVPPEETTRASPLSVRWGAAVLGKGDRRWTRDLLIRLPHGDHHLTYQETPSPEIFLDGVKVGDYSTKQSSVNASLRRGHRAWRRWIVPLLDGQTQLPLILSVEIAILTNKMLSLHIQVANRIVYAEGNPPPPTGWE